MEHHGRPGHDRGAAGRAAEQRALSFLESRGLRLIERNFRCRLGEIDLVMRDGPSVVFVEVRLRRGGRFGGALESIGASKLGRVRRAAEFWLRRNACTDLARIDVVALDGPAPASASLSWLRGVAD